MSNTFEIPKAAERRMKLVPPYFSGSGKNFDTILMFHEGLTLSPGMMLGVDSPKMSIIRVMAPSIIEEDFFENITVTLCQLVTNNANEEVDYRARELYYMYSAASE